MLRLLSFVACTLFVAGCSCSGAPPTTDTGARTDAPPLDAFVPRDAPATSDVITMDVPSVIDAPSTTDTLASLDTQPVTDSSSATDAPVSTTDAPIVASDAPGSLRVTISDPYVYGNCFPVPPDPVIAGWDVTITGASGSTATLTSAELTVTAGPTTFTQTLMVDVTTVPLTGGSGMVSMRKTSGMPSSVPGCSACGSGGGATYTLELVFLIDGVSVPKTTTGSYDCVV